MTTPTHTPPADLVRHRILLVDDNPSIHADFQKILCPKRLSNREANRLEAILFDEVHEVEEDTAFELASAYQGQAALELVTQSMAEHRPFALAFVDVRMPPGWDGVETVSRLWQVHPRLQVVICTAYSDYSWEEMRARLGRPDNLVVLKKPFDNVEVQQLAHALVRKWELNLQAEAAVSQLERVVGFLQALLGQQPHGTPTPDGALLSGDAPPVSPLPLEVRVDELLTQTPAGNELDGRMRRLTDNHQLTAALLRVKDTLEATVGQLRETELHLVQVEKLASLGRMSAGIIHEISHPLDLTLSALGQLGRHTQHLPPVAQAGFQELLGDTREGLQRISRVVADLRDFSQQQEGELGWVDLARTVNAALRLLRTELKEPVVVDNRIPADFQVWAVESRLLQVLLNLTQNSLDALRTKWFAPGTPPRLRFEAGTEGERKVVRVWDNGPGIPACHMAKVFDPFFTTKQAGLGTGLGLSVCYRLLHAIGARILVRSEENQYCEVTLSFPAGPERAEAAAPSSATPQELTLA